LRVEGFEFPHPAALTVAGELNLQRSTLNPKLGFVFKKESADIVIP